MLHGFAGYKESATKCIVEPRHILIKLICLRKCATPPCKVSCIGALFVLVRNIQYIPRNMHTVFALLCFVVVIHWLIFPYPSGLLHWHCGNLTIAPVPAKQPWWIWINTSCEIIMNDCITTTKQNTTKPCAYFSGYTVHNSLRSKCVSAEYSVRRRGWHLFTWRRRCWLSGYFV